MTTIQDQLLRGSFGGAPFNMKSSRVEGGRNTQTHEYVNAESVEQSRFVEDLGPKAKSFSLPVETSGIGQNYYNNRDALIKACESGGVQELVHPTLGIFQVVLISYTLDESRKKWGIADFQLKLEQSGTSVQPTQSGSNVSQVNLLNTQVRQSTSQDIVDTFGVSINNPSNYTDAVTTLLSFSNGIQTIVNNNLQLVDQISAFNAAIFDWERNINTNVRNPELLSTSMNNIFNEFELVGATPESQFTMTRELFDFGADREPINPTTVQLIERNNNRNVIDNTVRTNALAIAYDTTTRLELDNVEAIDAQSKILETQYEFVTSENSLSGDTLNTLKNLRVETRNFLDNERVTASEVIEIDTNITSMTLLAYQIYGDVENTDRLIELNNTINPAYIEGTQKVLSA